VKDVTSRGDDEQDDVDTLRAKTSLKRDRLPGIILEGEGGRFILIFNKQVHAKLIKVQFESVSKLLWQSHKRLFVDCLLMLNKIIIKE
jgi:hypothetical protein